MLTQTPIGLYSLSGKTSHHQIHLQLTGLGVEIAVPILMLTNDSVALLPRRLSNFRAIRELKTNIWRLQVVVRSGGITSYRLLNRRPGAFCVQSGHYTLRRPCIGGVSPSLAIMPYQHFKYNWSLMYIRHTLSGFVTGTGSIAGSCRCQTSCPAEYRYNLPVINTAESDTG